VAARRRRTEAAPSDDQTSPALQAGFEVSPLRSYGLVETVEPRLTLTWVERGADALLNRGQIGEECAAMLKAEARRRAESNTFFGYMAYASLVGHKPHAMTREP
jgi:hypothetical protein